MFTNLIRSRVLSLSTLLLSAVVLVAVALFGIDTKSVSAAPAVFKVTNTNDSGSGSLRQAIADANSNGNPNDQDVIQFEIPGSGTHRIVADSSLTITQSVEIDGYTQDDATVNTVAFPEPMDGLLRVEIVFGVAGKVQVNAGNVTIKGLAISEDRLGTPDGTIQLNSANNFKLYGSYIGTFFTGFTTHRFTQNDVADSIEINDSTNVSIGGSDPAQRNVIGHCLGSCIMVNSTNSGDTSGLKVQGNYIGVGADGLTALNGFDSIAIQLNSGVEDTQIGGASSGEGNQIANSEGAILAVDVDTLSILSNNILYNKPARLSSASYASVALLGVTNADVGVSGSGNVISGALYGAAVYLGDSPVTNQASSNIRLENNSLGYNQTGQEAFSNHGKGILVGGHTTNALIQANAIHNSSDQGIYLSDQVDDISMLQNSIYNNGNKGIDMEAGTNDSGDGDTGPNGKLNYPEWYDISESGGDTTIDFTADLPAGDYRVEFFSNTVADDSGRGEGETYLGYANITSAGHSDHFSTTLAGVSGVQNLALTATEIVPDNSFGYGATSEFGGEGIAPSANFKLTKTLDNPEGFVQNGVVNYTFTLENNGGLPADLTAFDCGDFSNPFANCIMVDFLPPDMTFVGVESGDITCTNVGALGNLESTIFATHLDYQGMFCPYTGSETALAPGDSVNFTLSFQISSDSNLNYTNYATYGQLSGSAISNVMNDCFSAMFTPPGTDYDLIDCLLRNDDSEDYIAEAGAPTAISVNKEFSAPDGVLPGKDVSYELTFTNTGPGDVSLAWYNNIAKQPSQNMLTDIFPGGDLTYINATSDTDGVDCYDVGPGTASLIGTGASDHPDHEIVTCYYGGDTNAVIPAGESIHITLHATVNNNVSSSFTNYVFSNSTLSDANSDLLTADFVNASEDVLDSATSNYPNAHKVTYSVVANEGTDTDGDGVLDSVENAGPNDGDANNDGTKDYLQANVKSFISPITGDYVVLAVPQACTIAASELEKSSANTVGDGQYRYPLGLLGFTISCGTPGYTASVYLYFYNQKDEGYLLRKYYPNSKNYSTIESALINHTTIDGNSVLVSNYELTDGSSLDLDGLSNGYIVDPVGLALKDTRLSATGRSVSLLVMMSLTIIGYSLTAIYHLKMGRQRSLDK